MPRNVTMNADAHRSPVLATTTYMLHSRGPARNWTSTVERTARATQREFVCQLQHHVDGDAHRVPVLVEALDGRGAQIAFEPGLSPGEAVALELRLPGAARPLTLRLPCRVEQADGEAALLLFERAPRRGANGPHLRASAA